MSAVFFLEILMVWGDCLGRNCCEIYRKRGNFNFLQNCFSIFFKYFKISFLVLTFQNYF